MSGELLNEAHELLRSLGHNTLADAVAENYGKIVSLRAELAELRALEAAAASVPDDVAKDADAEFMRWSVGKFTIGRLADRDTHVYGNTDFALCRYVWNESAAILAAKEKGQ